MRPYIFRLPEWLGQIPDWIPGIGGAQIGGRPLFSYGVMLGTSIFLGWFLALLLNERMGISRKKLNTILGWSFVGAILGARLMYFAASAPDDISLARFFQFSKGGLVAYGGFIGGLSTSVVLARITKVDWWTAADGTAPSMLLGTGITRIGCWSFGCDFGLKSNAFWGIQFPQWNIPALHPWMHGHSPAYMQHYPSSAQIAAPVLSDPVLPAQLIMSLNGFIGFFLLMAFFPRRKFRGQMILLFFIYYGATRFLIELIRGDTLRGTTTFGLPLSTSQFVSVAILMASIPLWMVLRKKNATDVQKP